MASSLEVRPASGGIVLTTNGGNTIAGNYFGTDAGGQQRVPNSNGILISSSYNTIGGATPGSRNVISGALWSGIAIQSGIDNVIQGNYIGTNYTGKTPVGDQYGVTDYGSENTIGGAVAGVRNIISGSGDGVNLWGGGSKVLGNYIGTDVTGAAPLKNTVGVSIQGNRI